MLAEFFCHDGGETQGWRLKGHAKATFWRWVASWAALIRKPSDLGYDDDGYALPPLVVTNHTIPADAATVAASGLLFAEEASTLTERRDARRGSLESRVLAAVAAMTECTCEEKSAPCTCDASERWIVWCDLNVEQDMLESLLGEECISIYGSLDSDEKERRMESFLAGGARILIGKPSIFGFGLNLQMLARMAFVGVTDSWEAYYQAVRREWRFGQLRDVHVHIFSSELEGAVIANLRRKEADALSMAEELSAETRDAVRAEIGGQTRTTNTYDPQLRMVVPAWICQEVTS
jgi:hypothetical protein